MRTLHRFPAIAAALVLGLSLPATAQDAAPPGGDGGVLLNAELTDVRDAGAG